MLDKSQVTLRLNAADIASMSKVARLIAGPRGAAYVGPTAIVRYALAAVIGGAKEEAVAE